MQVLLFPSVLRHADPGRQVYRASKQINKAGQARCGPALLLCVTVSAVNSIRQVCSLHSFLGMGHAEPVCNACKLEHEDPREVATPIAGAYPFRHKRLGMLFHTNILLSVPLGGQHLLARTVFRFYLWQRRHGSAGVLAMSDRFEKARIGTQDTDEYVSDQNLIFAY